MAHKPSLLLLGVAALFVTGCNGGGTSSIGSLASSGSVVYLADQNTDGVFELFLASSGAKLNGPLVPGGNVVSFALTPDKSAVVYIADQQTDEVFELWQVNIATPGVSVKLNGTLVLQGDVTSFAITPDGTSVVYRADQRFDEMFEVFRVLFATPQASTVLNPPFLNGSGKRVTQFAVTPDSTKVVYIANQDSVNIDELYQAAFLNPQIPTKLNVTLVPGGNVTNFAVALNSASVVYLADQRIDQVFELFLSPTTGPGSTTSLNPPLSTGQTVTAFAITPDSSAVIYRANNTPTGVFGLFRVTFALPQTSVITLNGALTAGGNVSSFAIAPDGSAVVYSADQNIFGVVEIFRVPLTAVAGVPCPGALSPVCAPQKINPNFAAPQSVSAFAIAPDSSAAVYLANQTVSTVTQLYRVPFSCLQANPAPSCPQAVPPPANLPPLNGALVAGGNVSSLAVSPDSTLVFYLADQTTFGVTELYAVNVGSPGSSSKLSGQLVPGGNVTAFTF
jgi:WD40-like Beta Propeller Repeat